MRGDLSGGLSPAASLRGLREEGMHPGGPAPLIPAAPADLGPRRAAPPPPAARARRPRLAPGLQEAARHLVPGGLEGEPQAGAADLEGGRPAGPTQEEAPPPRSARTGSHRRGLPEPRLGDGLPVRRHRPRTED